MAHFILRNKIKFLGGFPIFPHYNTLISFKTCKRQKDRIKMWILKREKLYSEAVRCPHLWDHRRKQGFL